jgi:hypothetical protein
MVAEFNANVRARIVLLYHTSVYLEINLSQRQGKRVRPPNPCTATPPVGAQFGLPSPACPTDSRACAESS